MQATRKPGLYLSKVRRQLKIPEVPKRLEFLTDGAESEVYRDKVTKKIVKVWTNSANARIRFYEHKIAGILFPGNILQYDFATSKVRRDGKRYLAISVSKPISTSEGHKITNSLREDPQSYRKRHDHYKSFESKDVAELLDEMENLGIFVDDFESNFDRVNGKPFFFEVIDIDIRKLLSNKEYIEKVWGRRKRLLIEAFCKRIIQLKKSRKVADF